MSDKLVYPLSPGVISTSRREECSTPPASGHDRSDRVSLLALPEICYNRRALGDMGNECYVLFVCECALVLRITMVTVSGGERLLMKNQWVRKCGDAYLSISVSTH
jgi:hypothetical protein